MPRTAKKCDEHMHVFSLCQHLASFNPTQSGLFRNLSNTLNKNPQNNTVSSLTVSIFSEISTKIWSLDTDFSFERSSSFVTRFVAIYEFLCQFRRRIPTCFLPSFCGSPIYFINFNLQPK